MAIYRLRISFEEYEDVYRDIEIRSSQTFEEFHDAILTSIGFDKKHAASFFVCDSQWRKGTEITLLEEDLEDGVRLMKKTKISACVEDPYQQFIYVYDKIAAWSFTIQMIKIMKEEGSSTYPVCIKSFGTAPKQYKPTPGSKETIIDPLAAAAIPHEDDVDDEAYRMATDKPEELLTDEDTAGFSDDENDGNENQDEEENNDEVNDEEDFGGYADDEH
jgi:hypothetical protein